ncbi:hypothetical protein D3C80_1507060 [compost metagenome]
MLGRACDPVSSQRTPLDQLPLQPQGHRPGVGRADFRMLAIALIGPPPTIIARDRQGGAKGPVGARGRDLLGRGFANAPDQVGVTRGAEADVVWKERRPHDVIVSMNRVDAEHEGHRRPRSRRSRRPEGAR